MNVKVMYEAVRPAKLIGREVHFVEGRTGNPRSGENSFVRLKNGDILNMYSEFYGGDDWSDHGVSRISGFISHDEGETWGESFPIFEVSEGYTDLMCACALRLSDGDLAALYLARIENSKCTQMFFARSKDEGKTWDVFPTMDENDTTNFYHVLENDRLVELKSGRLLFPTSYRPEEIESDDPLGDETFLTVHYSDDGGKSWTNVHADLKIPFIHTTFGLQEPGIIEMPDGRLRMWARTNLGCQYESFSEDGGLTWSVPTPMEFFKSPLSPMMMKNIGDMAAAVYNPEPFHLINEKPRVYLEKNAGLFYDRTPIVISVSDNGGKDFSRTYLLEEDPYSIYCYPAIFDGGEYILVSYYHSNRTENFFHSMKTVKIMKKELKEAAF